MATARYMVDKAVADGYNVIVMPGYAFAGTIVESAATYPEVKFVALDVAAGDILGAALGDKYDYNPANWKVTDYYNSDNVYCAVYQEELCGYMNSRIARREERESLKEKEKLAADSAAKTEEGGRK